MLQKNIDLLKRLEGFRSTAYRDVGGVWTIGYGHTQGVKEGDRVTEVRANTLLLQDIAEREPRVHSAVSGLGLNNDQKDALTILTFRIGIYAFLASTLLRKIKTKASRQEITFQWNRWVYVKGRIVNGLRNRAKAELGLYLSSESVISREEGQEKQSEARAKYLKHTVSSYTTVSDFINNNSSLFDKKVSKRDILSFKGSDGLSNSERIYKEYSKSDRENPEIKKKWINNDLDFIEPNTLIMIPVSLHQEELQAIYGSNVFLSQDKEIQAYFAEKRAEMLEDPSYIKLETLTRKGRGVNVQTIEQNCLVLLYLKSIDKLIDLSPFILSLTTSKTDVGSFDININPIEILFDRESNNITASFLQRLSEKDYINSFNSIKDEKVNISFLEKYCQQNDTVFIRFEKLKSDDDIVRIGNDGIEVDKRSISLQNWDMMGLVDNVASMLNTENQDMSVGISGRDFMKILVEDGSYMIPFIYARGAKNTFYSLGNSEENYFKRNYIDDGAFQYIFKYQYNPIKTYLGFIVNQLSSVSWSGDNDLFDYYPESERAEKYRIGVSDEDKYLENIEKNGVWKICKIKDDPALSDRRITDGSFLDADGTLYEQIKKACQEPFVEFWGDTVKNEFNFITRQQPFDRRGMNNILENKYYIDIEPEDVFQINLSWETEFYSWFQFYPNSNLFGGDDYALASLFPAVYLNEYVENFGNHRLSVRNQYLSGAGVDSGERNEDFNIIIRSLFNDLKYVIESYSVLPFTRTGTVIINGDRRIKKGDFVRLKVTGEICYVDSVQNSVMFSNNIVNRYTTLSLKRCMFENYITGYHTDTELTNRKFKKTDEEVRLIAKLKQTGVVLDDINLSPVRGFTYYDIVKVDSIIKDLIEIFESGGISEQTSQTSLDFGVNPEVFDFFLKRRQLDSI